MDARRPALLLEDTLALAAPLAGSAGGAVRPRHVLGATAVLLGAGGTPEPLTHRLTTTRTHITIAYTAHVQHTHTNYTQHTMQSKEEEK